MSDSEIDPNRLPFWQFHIIQAIDRALQSIEKEISELQTWRGWVSRV